MELVYFLYAEGAHLVKIGWTKNIVERVRAIRKVCPHDVRLLAVRPGTRDIEASYHRHFRSERQHGEWFFFDDQILKLMCLGMRTRFPEEWAYVESQFDQRAPELRNAKETHYRQVTDVLDMNIQDIEESMSYLAYVKERANEPINSEE